MIKRFRNEFFTPPCTTLNVGTLSGGRAKNIIPGESRFLLEWRPIPGFKSAILIGTLQEVIVRLRRRYRGTRITLRILRSERAFEVPGSSPLVRALEEASGHRAESIAFNSEAPQFTAMGAEAIVFGPGDMRMAHKTGEFVPTKELRAMITILRTIIPRFCGSIPPHGS